VDQIPDKRAKLVLPISDKPNIHVMSRSSLVGVRRKPIEATGLDLVCETDFANRRN